jgi:hypothetical protein
VQDQVQGAEGGQGVWELQEEQEEVGEVDLPVRGVEEEEAGLGLAEVGEEALLVKEEEEVEEEQGQRKEGEEEEGVVQMLVLMLMAEPDSLDRSESQSFVSCTPLSDLRPLTSVCGETCVGWELSAGDHSPTCSPSALLGAPRSPPCPR